MSGQVRRYVLGTYLNSAGVEGGGGEGGGAWMWQID